MYNNFITLCTMMCIISPLCVSTVRGQQDTPTIPEPPSSFDPSSAPTTTSNSTVAVVRVQRVEVPASVTQHQIVMNHKVTGKERVIYEGKVKRGGNFFWKIKEFDNGYLMMQETSRLDFTFKDRFMVYVGTNWSFKCIREWDE